ncbi:protein O-mannosyl-transferase family [Nannocystaceae bacterium ST9]
MRVHELSPPDHRSGTRPDRTSPAWPLTLGVVACCLVITAVCLPRAVQAGDAGEFSTVLLAGGVPHPPGYPWMRLLGPFARLGLALGLPPASAAALPPALAGVAAWGVLHRICVGLDRPWLGAFLILLIASSPLVIAHVPDCEVWGVHLLLSALFLRAATRSKLHASDPMQARRHALRLGLWLGLAVSHHQTAIFLIPIAIAAALPEPLRLRPLLIHALMGVAGSLIGLLPWLTLAIGSGGAWRWGDTQSAAGLLHHVLRADYGTTQLSLHEGPVTAAATIGRMLANLGEVLSSGLVTSAWFGGLLLLATAVALGSSLRRGASSNLAGSQATVIGLMLGLLAASVGFAAIQNIDPASAPGAWILERFDLLPLLLWIPLLALALGEIHDRLRPSLAGVRPALLAGGAIAIALVLLAAQLGALLDRGRPADERSVELAALDLVETPDPTGPTLPGTPIRAIVLGTDDHRSFPVLYVQSVLGAGEHVLYVDAILFTQPWYRAWIRRRFPELPDAEKPLELIGALWSDPRLDDVPIYLANVFSRPANELAKVPEGLLWRVVPPHDHPIFVPEQWTSEAIVERHLAACDRMAIRADDFPSDRSDRAAWAHPWSSDLRYAYVEKAHALVRALERSGDRRRIPEVLDALRSRTGVTLDSEP